MKLMRNELEKFNETVGILVKAYLNDTLRHGNCYACAVGNIIGHKLNVKWGLVELGRLGWLGYKYPAYDCDENNEMTGWGAAFCTDVNHGDNYEAVPRIQRITPEALNNPKVFEQIEASGYTWQELALIEFAFENVDGSGHGRMFNGLMAVVDVLAEIHGIDLTAKEHAKTLFVKS